MREREVLLPSSSLECLSSVSSPTTGLVGFIYCGVVEVLFRGVGDGVGSTPHRAHGGDGLVAVVLHHLLGHLRQDALGKGSGRGLWGEQHTAQGCCEERGTYVQVELAEIGSVAASWVTARSERMEEENVFSPRGRGAGPICVAARPHNNASQNYSQGFKKYFFWAASGLLEAIRSTPGKGT